MPSSYTTNYGIEQPALGSYVNDWNVPVNNNWALLDQALGATTQISLAAGSVTMTVAQAAYVNIIVSGTLTSNVQLIFPSGIGGRRYVWNQTGGQYPVTVLNGSGDTGSGIVAPLQIICPVILTGTQAYYDNYQSCPPGEIKSYAGSTAPPGFLLCTGASLSTTAYPLLFNAIGYAYGGSGSSFNIPDTRGRILAGADNMGGTAANRLTGYAVATTGGAQSVTLTSSQIPATGYTVTDPGHTHTASDSGHTHGPQSPANYFIVNLPTASGGLSIPGASGLQTTATSTATGYANITNASATTGISVSVSGGGNSHTNVQPTLAVNHIIRF